MNARKKPDELSELWPDYPVALLQSLHILTRDEKLNADSRRKLKQISHLLQLLEPPLTRLLAADPKVRVADLGAGKSYLAFILFDRLLKAHPDAQIFAIEQRGPLMQAAQELARACQFERMNFMEGAIAGITLDHPIEMVTALHACDIATDDAIRFALRHDAKVVALIPCCQAELSRLLESESRHPLHQLWRHPIQRRDIAANITNVIRALFLEAHGYKVRVTEFVGLEHSMKNELILGERHQRSNAQAKGELQTLLKQLPVRPALVADFS